MRSQVRAVAIAVLSLIGVVPRTARAIPAFARKYRVSCMQCHAPVPRLNSFGEAFAANGYEFAVGEPPRDTIATGDPLLRLQNDLPLAIRYDAYVQALTNPASNQNSIDFQTPWVIKLLSGGQVTDKVSYYVYFLMTEGGAIEGLEDAWLQFTDIAGSGVSLQVGQFQVSDPMFKRELRLEFEDYQAYRVKVGLATADLTYERGVTAYWSPRAGTDLAFELVNGRGLNQASGSGQYDTDDAKNGVVRLSQDIGSFRVGAFGYRGREVGDGVRNTISMWGPDMTIPLGSVGELNATWVQRKDSDPFFGTCSVATPCPGNATTSFSTTVNSGFAEAVFWPQGQTGRLFFTALYNLVDSDRPVVSLEVGEQDVAPGYLSRYQTAAAGVHYLFKRNVRFMGEAGWDLEREQMRFTLGTVLAF
jgi:hypothetical protein